MKSYAIILASGSGVRFGATSVPKHMTLIHGKPCFVWTVGSAIKSRIFSAIVIVTQHKDMRVTNDAVSHFIKKSECPIFLTEGANERMASFAKGLQRLCTEYSDAGQHGIVALIDANRPLIPPQQLCSLNIKTKEFGCACPGRGIVNGVARARDGKIIEVPNKSEYIEFVTPEFINLSLISSLARDTTYKFKSLVEYALDKSVHPFILESSILNTKLTYPEDISVLEGLVTEYQIAALPETFP